MQQLLKPLKTDSLKDVFVQRFEELILSGALSIGQKLPPERELALMLGVSRPVVHEGLVDLENKGLVTMKPRVGTVVNDYRREGSLSLLNSLVSYNRGRLEPAILDSLLEIRILIELETAKLAAEKCGDGEMKELHELLDEETDADRRDIGRIVELDFRFHLLVAIASGNILYPLLLNSFREVYTNLTRQFFEDDSVVDLVFRSHRELYGAIRDRNARKAVAVMKKIIGHGERHLRAMVEDSSE